MKSVVAATLLILVATCQAGEEVGIAMNTATPTARSLKQAAHAEIAKALASISDRELHKRVEAAANAVLNALNHKSWIDDNHVDKANGAGVFTLDEAAVNQLAVLLDNEDVPASLQARINAAALKLSESNRILTQSVNGVLQPGDNGRADGNYQGAIRAYKRAWLSAL
jgi:hypothetical protein